jgi:hypothetical protein
MWVDVWVELPSSLPRTAKLLICLSCYVYRMYEWADGVSAWREPEPVGDRSVTQPRLLLAWP